MRRIKLKKVIWIILSYLVVFLVTIGISDFAMNQGKVRSVVQEAESSLPVLYVKSGGRMLNEMHGYKTPVDAGYYRDTLTPVGDSYTINLCLDTYDTTIVSGSYELYNDQYTTLIESGTCTEPEKADAMLQMQIVFGEKLNSNREYCLRIMLTDADGEVLNYYTRVRYGSDLKVAEKLKFVLDFNEATFDKDSALDLEDYLETTSYGSSDFSLVTLYSSSDVVTWGSLEPYRTSDLSIRLKEINTETAAFTLAYTVESSAAETTSFYNVTEYYRIRVTSDKIYLLDFQREMQEIMSLTDASVTDGAIRIGIGDSSELSSESYGEDTHSFAYVENGQQLWVYDHSNRILTEVYSESDGGHNCAGEDETGIRVIHGDPVTGDLYFTVYGYMHSGNFEGQEGVLIYHFSYEDVMLEELMFIPFDKGYEQLETGISQLAYMNDSGEIYLMLEDTVYCVNVDLGRLEVAWTGLNSDNSAASNEGILAMTEGENGEQMKVIDLDTGKEKIVNGGDWMIRPLGFSEDDLIYGLIDPKLAAADSNGVVQMPISEVHIVDSSLNEIKNYKKSGSYVMDLTVTGGNIQLSLGKAVKNGAYTDYEDAGEDYIVRNSTAAEGEMYLKKAKSGVRGMQNWLQLDTTDDFLPITQTARYIDPGYDITRTYTPSESVELCYYVYTKGCLEASYNTIQEAIAYVNAGNYGGTVMTSHKQVAWQRAGRAYIWDLDIDSIEQVSETDSLNRILLQVITDYEGWNMPASVDGSLPLFAAMTEYLPAETINLTGLELTDVLHFVYRDRLVAARISDTMYALIIAYDTSYIQLADPENGDTYWISWSAAENLFEAAGNVYYSYFD